MEINYYPTEGLLVIEDFQGEEAEIIMALTYLRGMVSSTPEGLDESITLLMQPTLYDS